ncbi:T9SS type B sorting domain-containing protein [uncultured Winogradskyella sp.]|uniref:T9SS type B sorting domain-containing protein n=1 Tax=uncultured Winogradskyella sp. TaxID=395353 RepID=UPI0026026A96|nr:T9SS type B sorting domain-containing protein [uncultured Winogradskyella sp.]
MRLILALLFVSASILSLCAQDLPPEIAATGDQGYCPSVPINIVTSVSITDPDVTDTTLDEIFIQISEGYASGFDVLTLTGIHPNITPVWQQTEGQLVLNGPATFAEFEAAILDVEFTTTQTIFSSDRSFSINLGNANYLPSTDHYYFYIASFGITWADARAEAATRDYFGLQGYLATITTPEEAQLTGEQASGAGWIGATDEETENIWKWVTGPEAGTEFFDQSTFSPINGEFSFWNTNEPNNFGAVGEDYAHITDPSIGILGSWNDLPLAGDPDVNGPYHPKGYIIEFGGLPGDPAVNLSAATSINMPQLSFENEEGCEGDEITLTLTTNTDEVIWYDGPSSPNVVNTGGSYTAIFNTTTTLWISARFMGCADGGRSPLTVTIDSTPESNDITIQQCDDASADGISVFNLEIYSGLIANASVSNVVSFFEDNQFTIPINASSYTNTSNNQIVYARVLNPTSGCFAIAEVTLSVSLPAIENFELSMCDDEEEDGFTEFNLSDLNDEVLMGMPVTAQTSFFPTFNDALLNTNQFSNSYINAMPNNETIFVKVTDALACLGIFEVNLEVKPLPELLLDEKIIYCLDIFPSKIVLDSGIVNGIPNNFYYNWSTLETTIQIEVNEPGLYWVDVTEVNGCTNRRNIEVLPSSIAEFDSIDVIDGVENNIVTVNVSGDGDYEFSFTSQNGPFQDSNVFENVRSGIQTVYVRDKNGCGVVSESFPVIGFPKFFTPNGDSNNDFWTIDGFNEEFLANSRVQIFNRHGKLITELSAQNPIWDGRYNGNLMPSDDYWFLVSLQDGRTFTKHFALKR